MTVSLTPAVVTEGDTGTVTLGCHAAVTHPLIRVSR